MLTAVTTTSAVATVGSGITSPIYCSRSACVGTTTTRQNELKQLQTLANQLAAKSKLVYTPLAIDGAIGANTIALLQQFVSLLKMKTASPVVMDSVAANAPAWISTLKAAITLASALPATPPFVDPGTSIPGTPPPQPGAGVQVTPDPAAPPPAPPSKAGWSMTQKALVIGGGAVALVAVASMLSGGKKSPVTSAAGAVAGLFGLGRSRRRR